MKKLLKALSIFFGILLILAVSSLTILDRSDYKQSNHYESMSQILDSLEAALQPITSFDSLRVGVSRVNITPKEIIPMAGYGARKPKEFVAIHDSVFIKTVVFSDGFRKAAFVTADLLVIHNEVKNALEDLLENSNWSLDEIYLTATHTHSSIGQWAPGLVGSLFSGDYDSEMVHYLASEIINSIEVAYKDLQSASFSYNEIREPDFVKNRLVHDKGIVDPWIKVLKIKSEMTSLISLYSAHATCLSGKNRDISGDFPSALNSLIEADSTIDVSLYAAGPVGSMGPNTIKNPEDEWKEAVYLAEGLKSSFDKISFDSGFSYQLPIRSFRIPLFLGKPQFKINNTFVLRPWLFKKAFGNYEMDISVLQIDKTLLIGLPCDFSGELAMPLYDFARKKGLNLIISSFNGGYIGYVIKDEWYDLKKYEARTMSWYGPHNGAYISEVIQRIIQVIQTTS